MNTENLVSFFFYFPRSDDIIKSYALYVCLCVCVSCGCSWQEHLESLFFFHGRCHTDVLNLSLHLPPVTTWDSLISFI